MIDNIATSVGQKLIPGATRAVHMFNGIAEAIDNMLSKKDVTDYVFDFVKENNLLMNCTIDMLNYLKHTCREQGNQKMRKNDYLFMKS